MCMSPIIAPSVLAADFSDLRGEISMINQSDAEWIHIDIMDGVFVPNISFGLPVLQAINKIATKPLDVHLMIVQPERYLEAFKEAGAAVITVHYEASTHLHRTLQQIRQMGLQAGVAINPHTPVHLLEDIMAETDLLCLMSVNPGFGGQKFIERTYSKISQAKEIITRQGLKTKIEIDGGVTSANARQLVKAGADVLVAGSFVFSSENPLDTISGLKNTAAAL